MSSKIAFIHPPVADLLSIIVPVALDAEGLALTLASLATHRVFAHRVEVIVANDGGFAAVSEICARHPVREVVLTPNQGSYAARNAALAVSRGAFIAFLDADEQVTPGWLPAIRRALENADYVAGPVRIDDAEVRSLGQRLDALTAFPMELGLERQKFAPTANLAIRRSLVERIGGFSGWMRSGGDVEFGHRAHRAGARQIFEPDALVLHPPRNFRQQIQKMKRTTAGEKVLRSQFHDLPPQHWFQWYIRPILPPRRIVPDRRQVAPISPQDRVILFFLLWARNLIRLYFRYAPHDRYDLGRTEGNTARLSYDVGELSP